MEYWVTVKGGSLTFGIEVAAPLTEESVLPPGVKQIAWSHALDYEDTWWPWGPNEGTAVVYWDGMSFRGVWADMRTMLETGLMTETPLPFSVEGTVITITAPAQAMKGIGDLSSFDWWLNVHVTWNHPEHLASGYWLVDTSDNWPQPWPW